MLAPEYEIHKFHIEPDGTRVLDDVKIIAVTMVEQAIGAAIPPADMPGDGRRLAIALAVVSRLYNVACDLLDELAETIDGEWGCCHLPDEVRAGGRTEYDGTFEPLDAESCRAAKVLAEWQPKIDAARSGETA